MRNAESNLFLFAFFVSEMLAIFRDVGCPSAEIQRTDDNGVGGAATKNRSCAGADCVGASSSRPFFSPCVVFVLQLYNQPPSPR